MPNGVLFTNQVANYTEGFEYIWDEIPLLVTFESDRQRARSIIEGALREHAPDVETTAGARIRETARSYHIKIGALTPIVYLSVQDSGVLLTSRYLVNARQQRDVAQSIWTTILDGIDADASVELAYPTVRTYLHGPITIATDSPPTTRRSSGRFSPASQIDPDLHTTAHITYAAARYGAPRSEQIRHSALLGALSAEHGYTTGGRSPGTNCDSASDIAHERAQQGRPTPAPPSELSVIRGES